MDSLFGTVGPAHTWGMDFGANYNWAAFELGGMGASLKLASDIINIGTNDMKFAANNVKSMGGIAQSISNQGSLRSQVKSFRAAAGDAVKEAGHAQEQGRQAREQRLVVLGQQKGATVASAAGSGIEVSSKIVGKVLRDTVKSAYNDTEAIAQNEQQATQAKLNEALSMQINAERAEANIEAEAINQRLMLQQIKLNNRAARTAMIGGIMSAAGNLVSGLGGAYMMGASGNAGK